MSLIRLSRQKPPPLSFSVTLLTRLLSSSSSKLHDHYSFKPPPSLSPKPHNPNANPNPIPKKKQKPQYRPPSSLDRTGLKPIQSELPFDFRYSYTESSPTVRPIGLREPKYSPFGPGRLNREWTGVCAPAMDPKARSLEAAEDPKLEEKRKEMRERVQGEPLTEAERKLLVDKCQRHKTKRQINLGTNKFVFFFFFLELSRVLLIWSIWVLGILFFFFLCFLVYVSMWVFVFCFH